MHLRVLAPAAVIALVGIHPSWVGVSSADDPPAALSGADLSSTEEDPLVVDPGDAEVTLEGLTVDPTVRSIDGSMADPTLEPDVPVLPPGTSLSCGSANRGALRGAVEMPVRGPGFEVPEPWWTRGYRYGTSHMVELVARVAAAVEAEHPGSVLGVADLSKSTGGALPGHRSHQSGRDVDLHFYTLDPGGKAFPPDKHMPYFGRTGRATYAKAPSWSRSIPERYFDLARNWSLVKALITDDEVTVQNIFVSRRIRRWLLDYARALQEPDELVSRAAIVLRKAAGRTHNDHMHVRIGCSEQDQRLGRCKDSLASPRRGKRKYHSRVRCPARKRTPVDEAKPTNTTARKSRGSRGKRSHATDDAPPDDGATAVIPADGDLAGEGHPVAEPLAEPLAEPPAQEPGSEILAD